jgi:hypothetical protein
MPERKGNRVAKENHPHNWLPIMLWAVSAINVGTFGATQLLTAGGFPSWSASVLIAMACAPLALREPDPVVDGWLQWRVGIWGAMIVMPPVLLVDVVAVPLLPFWWGVGAVGATYVAALLGVGVAVDRWAQRWSYQQSQQKAQQ